MSEARRSGRQRVPPGFYVAGPAKTPGGKRKRPVKYHLVPYKSDWDAFVHRSHVNTDAFADTSDEAFD